MNELIKILEKPEKIASEWKIEKNLAE